MVSAPSLAAGPQGGGNASASASSASTYYALPDLTVFGALARRSLTDALEKIAGAKTLVLDGALAGQLGLVAEMGLLRENGVDKVYWLEQGALSGAQKNVVYVCRPELGLMKIIADQIKAAPAALNHSYTILMAPRVTSVCANALEEFGVLGSVELVEFPLAVIPLERDLLSLELEAGGYRDIFYDSNYDPITEMARALVVVQRIFGNIPRILGKGDASRRLVDVLARLRAELLPDTAAPSASDSDGSAVQYGQIDSVILLDRQVDMVTPLCTQLTYEGLIDEVIGIKNSFVEVDSALTNPAPPTPSSSTAPTFGAIAAQPKKKKHLLSTLGSPSTSNSASGAPASSSSSVGSANASDPLLAELRDRNFATIGDALHRIAKRINTDYEERHKAQTVGQMREFVGRLSGLQAEHQALRLHTGLSEQIMQTTRTDEFNRVLEIQQNLIAGIDVAAQEQAIRELINQEASVNSVLRLLCIFNLIIGSVKPKVIEEFKREILQTYGYEFLPLLISLEELNLISKSSPSSSASSSSKSAFAVSRRPLRLVVDDFDESTPEDISYVYSGYAPISVRLVQHALGVLPAPTNVAASATTAAAGLVSGMVSGVIPSGSPFQQQQQQQQHPGYNTEEVYASSVIGWKGIEEVMRTLPGTVFDEQQRITGITRRGSSDAITSGSSRVSANAKRSSVLGASMAPDQVPVTLVCFLGGCTYTEVAALRFTSQKMPGRKIVVLTTGMLNGNTIMDSLGPFKS